MTSQPLTLTILKKYFKECSKADLEKDIIEIYQGFPTIKDYYQVKLLPQSETQIIAKYKKVIENEFFPTRGFGKGRLAIAKKAIADYKKICRSSDSLIDIMLFYVEQGVKFTNKYGDIEEAFYLSMEGMFEKAVKLIGQNDLKSPFQKRCQKIVNDASETGWGFYDTLSELFDEAFTDS